MAKRWFFVCVDPYSRKILQISRTVLFEEDPVLKQPITKEEEEKIRSDFETPEHTIPLFNGTATYCIRD